MNLNQLAKKLFPAFLDNAGNFKPCCIFLSATDMKTRAVTRHAVADNPADAWNSALDKLKAAFKGKPFILRADWVVESRLAAWAEFLRTIEKTRRNYFRQGIALDADYKIALIEEELNSNEILFKEGKESSGNCLFQADRFDDYCKIRFACAAPTLELFSPIEIFTTRGIFITANDKAPLPLISDGIAAGHREISPLDADIILRMTRNAARYLSSQVRPSGQFIYGRLPCFNKVFTNYNTLRHFGAISALLDVYETYRIGEMTIGNAISRAIKYGVNNFIKYRTLDDGSEAAYVVETDDNEIKLGALGLLLLALIKHAALMKTKKYLPLMNSVARAIYTMQKPDGSFIHVLNADDFTVKEEFRVVYYDSEAVFGMMKLYALTHDENLLKASELAFQRFVATDHWKKHDSWLSYLINELTIYNPKREYFELGIKNFLDILPFMYHCDITFPALLELMMAADSMLERLKTLPEFADLLASVPLEDFYATLEMQAKNLLNGYFYPEVAMFFQKPENILGSFFIRYDGFRVRIDDMEHYLSALTAYQRYL
ncbi:MAG: hypothetical protein IJP68_12750, partial [Selenomonadaceae bacterium]|nr:hypothetical protein [Selenomonadaceae bacterium]